MRYGVMSIASGAVSVATLLAACSGCGAVATQQEVDAKTCFPPAGVDHMTMRVTVEVELAGLGRDRVALEGTVVVHRSGPKEADGKTMVGELVAASLRGTSSVFGEVVAMESPVEHSPVRYTCARPGEYHGRLSIAGWFWLPRHNLVVFNSAPVTVEGDATSIPPEGQEARMVGAGVPLHSFKHPTGAPIGTLLAATGRLGALVEVEDALEIPATPVPALLGAPAAGER